MKLIKPYTEIWEQAPGMEGMLRHIERCARVCYKSEDKIGEGTAEKMVEMLTKRGHTAMLEHGTVYLSFSPEEGGSNIFLWECANSPYSKIVYDKDTNRNYLTTNYRVLVENSWLDSLKYLCAPTKYHEKRVTVHFICDRGISHELVRHRVFSFAQESTRQETMAA